MRVVLLTALLLTATAAHAQQSIVVNGSFEEPQVGSAFGIFPTIPGWRTVSGPGIEVQSNSVGWSALAGTQMVELDSTAPSSMAQDLTTRPGGVYELSFSFSPRPPLADNRIGVYWNGQQVAVLDASGVGSSNTNWQRFTYRVTATGTTTELRFADLSGADALGGLIDDVKVMPAEELWLESQSAAPVSSQMVLEKGKPYRLTMQGTYTVWGHNIDAGTRSLQPEAAPMFPSPKGRTRNVGADPEFIFAWSKGHALEKNPAPAPLRNTIIQISLDGGKTWKHPATPDSFSATEHKYTYELMGDGNALQVRINDKPVADNFGRVQIFLLPGA